MCNPWRTTISASGAGEAGGQHPICPRPRATRAHRDRGNLRFRLRHGLRLLIMFLIGVATPGQAQDPHDVVQEFTSGRINWTQGHIFTTVEWSPPDDQFGKPVDPARALEAARANLLTIIKSIRIDAHTRLAHFSQERGVIFQKIHEMVGQATVLDREYLSDGSVKVTLKMDIWGGLAQLVLPQEIRQVDMIKPVADSGTKKNDTKDAAGSNGAPAPSLPAPYTGLVIDARGIPVQPALVAVVRDESHREVFGPAYVSREFVVQHGMCLYVRDIPAAVRIHPRVRYNPLIVKCLSPENEAHTDLLISDADAARLRSASENITFLREGRVIIVVD